MRYVWIEGSERRDVIIEETAPDHFVMRLGGKEIAVALSDFGGGNYNLLTANRSLEASVLDIGDGHLEVHLHDGVYPFRVLSPLQVALEGASVEHHGAAGMVKSPMPAKVVNVLVKVGDAVTRHQPLLILEAMKMQNEMLSPADGVVAAIHVTAGQGVEGNANLIEVI